MKKAKKPTVEKNTSQGILIKLPLTGSMYMKLDDKRISFEYITQSKDFIHFSSFKNEYAIEALEKDKIAQEKLAKVISDQKKEKPRTYCIHSSFERLSESETVENGLNYVKNIKGGEVKVVISPKDGMQDPERVLSIEIYRSGKTTSETKEKYIHDVYSYNWEFISKVEQTKNEITLSLKCMQILDEIAASIKSYQPGMAFMFTKRKTEWEVSVSFMQGHSGIIWSQANAFLSDQDVQSKSHHFFMPIHSELVEKKSIKIGYGDFVSSTSLRLKNLRNSVKVHLTSPINEPVVQQISYTSFIPSVLDYETAVQIQAMKLTNKITIPINLANRIGELKMPTITVSNEKKENENNKVKVTAEIRKGATVQIENDSGLIDDLNWNEKQIRTSLFRSFNKITPGEDGAVTISNYSQGDKNITEILYKTSQVFYRSCYLDV